MKKQFIIVKNRNGLHAKPAAELVKKASQYESEIFLIKDDITVSAKSIMDVLILAASYGTHLILQVEGADEDAAIKHIAKILLMEE